MPNQRPTWTKAILLLDLAGRFAAHDVIRDTQNFLEGEVTLLELRAVLNGSRLRALDPSKLLSTSPTKSFRNTRFNGPRHISTTGVALHLNPNQAHVHYELHCDATITKQVREKIPVRTTVFPQHRTSVWRPKNEGHLLQTVFVIRDLTNFLHHWCVAVKHRRQTLE